MMEVLSGTAWTYPTAHCDKHPLTAHTFEPSAEGRESMQRYVDEHNRRLHPRRYQREQRREAVLDELNGFFKEAMGDPTEADPEAFAGEPVLYLEPLTRERAKAADEISRKAV